MFPKLVLRQNSIPERMETVEPQNHEAKPRAGAAVSVPPPGIALIRVPLATSDRESIGSAMGSLPVVLRRFLFAVGDYPE